MTRTGALSSFRNRFLIASALVLITAAACGGDSSSDQPPSTLPETTTPADLRAAVEAVRAGQEVPSAQKPSTTSNGRTTTLFR